MINGRRTTWTLKLLAFRIEGGSDMGFQLNVVVAPVAAPCMSRLQGG